MNNNIKKTDLYIFNENGLVGNENLKEFLKELTNNSMFGFSIKLKAEIDPLSSIFAKLSYHNLELTIYDYGYVMKVEGDIFKSILLLFDLDRILNKKITIYVSPTQRIENNINLLYPRGAKLDSIALFLNKIFNSKEYLASLS